MSLAPHPRILLSSLPAHTIVQVVRGHTRAVSLRALHGRAALSHPRPRSTPHSRCGDLHATPPRRRACSGATTGHANVKNFVGLSVREDDELMATGSESGQAYTYHRAWSAPVAAHGFAGGSSQQSQQVAEPSQAGVSEFASAVCWLAGRAGRIWGRLQRTCSCSGAQRWRPAPVDAGQRILGPC